jgi:translation initiation factor 2B subunit (eIF-2B alpha/beta/delta family)
MRIRKDHRSGATTLLAQAIEAGRLFLIATRSLPPPRLLRQLERFTCQLASSQPSMGPFLALGNALWLAVENRRAGASPWLALHDSLVRYADDLDRGLIATVRQAADLVRPGSIVLTYSNSTAVRLALWRAIAEGKRFIVVCSESRPANEGVALAEDLAGRGVPVYLAVDAALFGWLGIADLVLTGADAIMTTGIVNKVGTRPLLETARRLHVPAYALADSTKWLPPRLAGYWRVRAESPAEVTRLRHPNLTVDNRYFDLSPLSLVTGVIWEEGVGRSSSIRKRLGQIQVSATLVNLLKASSRQGLGRVDPRMQPRVWRALDRQALARIVRE